MCSTSTKKTTQFSPEIIEERNTIISKWYRDKKIKSFLSKWLEKKSSLRELQIEGDHKNDVFIWLLNQPIEFLRNLDNGDWLGFINKKMLSSTNFEDHYFNDTPFTLEFFGEAFNDLFEVDLMNLAPVDLVLECKNEVDKLPYLHKICLQAYSKTNLFRPTIEELQNQGVRVSQSKELNFYLDEAREIVQNNLLKKGVIEKKIPYVRLTRFDKKPIVGVANNNLLVRNIRSVLLLLKEPYSKSWVLKDKCLFALLNHLQPLTSSQIYIYLSEGYDNELLEDNRAKAQNDIAKRLGKLVNTGLLLKRNPKGRDVQYYFPAIVQELFIKAKTTIEDDFYYSDIVWEIYIKHEIKKLSITRISKELNLSIEQITRSLQTTTSLINSVFDERKGNKNLEKSKNGFRKGRRNPTVKELF